MIACEQASVQRGAHNEGNFCPLEVTLEFIPEHPELFFLVAVDGSWDCFTTLPFEWGISDFGPVNQGLAG